MRKVINIKNQIAELEHVEQFIEEICVPKQITGYEYQFLACKHALDEGLTESPCMPLYETLEVMKIMDGLRRQWSVRYPMDPW